MLWAYLSLLPNFFPYRSSEPACRICGLWPIIYQFWVVAVACNYPLFCLALKVGNMHSIDKAIRQSNPLSYPPIRALRLQKNQFHLCSISLQKSI